MNSGGISYISYKVGMHFEVTVIVPKNNLIALDPIIIIVFVIVFRQKVNKEPENDRPQQMKKKEDRNQVCDTLSLQQMCAK